MAIQMRRGNEEDFNPNLLLPGEFAVSLDKKRVYCCFTRGTVIQLAVADTLEEALERIQEALDTLDETVKTTKSNSDLSRSYAVGTAGEVRENDATDNSRYYKEQAAIQAGNAAQTYQDIEAVIEEITPAFNIDFTTGHLSYAI